MRLKNLLAASALVLLTACTTTDETATVTTDGDIMVTDRAPITGLDVQGVDSEQQNMGPTPGTQQDLVVNVGDRVFFDYDQYDLRGPARAVVEKQVQWLKMHPNLSVTIEGHCDERGTREYNLALGEKRATSVRNYMIAMGVEPSRINTISYGKERPAVMGADAASWAQNRRSVTVVE